MRQLCILLILLITLGKASTTFQLDLNHPIHIDVIGRQVLSIVKGDKIVIKVKESASGGLKWYFGKASSSESPVFVVENSEYQPYSVKDGTQDGL